MADRINDSTDSSSIYAIDLKKRNSESEDRIIKLEEKFEKIEFEVKRNRSPNRDRYKAKARVKTPTSLWQRYLLVLSATTMLNMQLQGY